MSVDLFRPVADLAKDVQAKKLSPVALAEESLMRLDSHGRKLNAVVTLSGEAVARARDTEKDIAAGRYRGTLHGIPWGAKDLLATKGMPTTWGAEPYRDQRFDFDATAVRKLEEAGAILVAKLAMVELAGGMGYNSADASFVGPGLNPWNTGYWSGGSSSGSGAAVAAGLVPFAIGSETVGSIITPASFCGVTGLRPTYGLVSRHGAMALCWTLDKLGPLARTAEDAGTVIAAIAGVDPQDPTTVAAPKPRAARRLRVGIPKRATDFVHPEVRANFEASVRVLSGVADVVADVELPTFPYGPVAGTIVDAEGGSAFRALIESGGLSRLRDKSDHVGGYGSVLTPAVDYLAAMRLREKMRAPWAKVFESVDMLAAPGRPTVALPTATTFDKAWPELAEGRPADFVSPVGVLIQIGNLVGYPALVLPNGSGREGLPTAFQLLAPAHCEPELVALGRQYQSRTDFHRRRPAGY
jgi:aspartyl-tRNA(Asn)/glutamyl-tRNA(Gln) amidotransferase subunit A